MAKTDYAIMVEPLSEADGGGWLSTMPALSGCMGDGDTPEAALADAEAAIVEWQDAARQLQWKTPKPDALGQWRQRVPRSLHEKLKIVAAREGVSLNAYVSNVLAENVGRAGDTVAVTRISRRPFLPIWIYKPQNLCLLLASDRI